MNQSYEKTASGHKLKWRVFACFAGFTAAIILLLWLCQAVFLDDIYKSIKTADIKTAANELTRSLRDNKNDYASLDKDSRTIAKRNDLCIRVIKMENSNFAVEVVSVDNLKNCIIHRMDGSKIAALYNQCNENGGMKLIEYDEEYREGELNEDFFSGTKPFNNEKNDGFDNPISIIYTVITEVDGEIYFTMLNSVISPDAATVRTLNLLLAAISVLLIILAFVLAAIMSKSISSPITRITESAKRMALGNYDAVFDGKGYREVSELADALNYAEGELSRLDNMRRDLLANISHDLRTPLTMISGYSEIMRDIPGENTPENAQIILDEANRLTSLVNDVLDISKLESGQFEPDFKVINLTETVRMSLEKYSRLCEKEGYTINFYADRDVFAYTDATGFMQALYNLINNALTYTGEDKMIHVSQTLTDDSVRISVRDTGEGIPADKLPVIWDRYYKVDSYHRRAARGSGLGLSIVRNIMESLGGRYGVISAVGKGSRFWIEIPLANAEDGTIETKE